MKRNPNNKQKRALTDKQKRVLTAIAVLTRQHGFCPTFREIADECGYATTSVVAAHLDRLRENGLVEWTEGKARTIRLVKP